MTQGKDYSMNNEIPYGTLATCDDCGQPIMWDDTEMWQHVRGEDSDACQPVQGIYPSEDQ